MYQVDKVHACIYVYHNRTTEYSENLRRLCVNMHALNINHDIDMMYSYFVIDSHV